MGRRNFDPEYKLRVARLVEDGGQGVPQVVRDTGVGETAIWRWVEHLMADRAGEAGHGVHFRKRTADCGRTRPC